MQVAEALKAEPGLSRSLAPSSCARWRCSACGARRSKAACRTRNAAQLEGLRGGDGPGAGRGGRRGAGLGRWAADAGDRRSDRTFRRPGAVLAARVPRQADGHLRRAERGRGRGNAWPGGEDAGSPAASRGRTASRSDQRTRRHARTRSGNRCGDQSRARRGTGAPSTRCPSRRRSSSRGGARATSQRSRATGRRPPRTRSSQRHQRKKGLPTVLDFCRLHGVEIRAARFVGDNAASLFDALRKYTGCRRNGANCCGWRRCSRPSARRRTAKNPTRAGRDLILAQPLHDVSTEDRLELACIVALQRDEDEAEQGARARGPGAEANARKPSSSPRSCRSRRRSAYNDGAGHDGAGQGSKCEHDGGSDGCEVILVGPAQRRTRCCANEPRAALAGTVSTSCPSWLRRHLPGDTER